MFISSCAYPVSAKSTPLKSERQQNLKTNMSFKSWSSDVLVPLDTVEIHTNRYVKKFSGLPKDRRFFNAVVDEVKGAYPDQTRLESIRNAVRDVCGEKADSTIKEVKSLLRKSGFAKRERVKPSTILW